MKLMGQTLSSEAPVTHKPLGEIRGDFGNEVWMAVCIELCVCLSVCYCLFVPVCLCECLQTMQTCGHAECVCMCLHVYVCECVCRHTNTVGKPGCPHRGSWLPAVTGESSAALQDEARIAGVLNGRAHEEFGVRQSAGGVLHMAWVGAVHNWGGGGTEEEQEAQSGNSRLPPSRNMNQSESDWR